jgi:hypothetical protein
MSGEDLGNSLDKLRFIRLVFQLSSAGGKEAFVEDGFVVL